MRSSTLVWISRTSTEPFSCRMKGMAVLPELKNKHNCFFLRFESLFFPLQGKRKGQKLLLRNGIPRVKEQQNHSLTLTIITKITNKMVIENIETGKSPSTQLYLCIGCSEKWSFELYFCFTARAWQTRTKS